MAKRKSSKDIRPDFLRDQGDRIEKISAKDVWSAITLKHEPTRKVVGFLLVVFSAVLAIAFTSFFFSWKLDQSLMTLSDDGLSYFNGSAKNAMGYYGAKLAFQFVHNGFGLAAYALLPYIALTGLYLLFDYRPFSLLRIAVHTILFTVWCSLFFGFAMRWWPLMSGSFGFFGNQQIETAIGGVGSFFFLAAYAVAYSMFFFNANPFARIKMNYDANGERLEAEVIEPSGFEASIQEDFAIEEELNVVDVELEDDAEELTPAQRAALTQISLKITETTEPIVPEIEEEANTNPGAGINTLLGDEDFKVEVMADEADDAVDENTGDNSMERMGIDTVYDPTQELSKYVFPTLDLLQEHDAKKQEIDMQEIQRSKDMIIQTLENYKIGISSIKASVGPTVTLYEIVPAPGVKISKIKNLEDDIALSLAALGIRIIAPIPGKGTIGIEVPNKNPEMVPMRSVLASKKFQDCDFQLPVILGKTISNEIFVADLAKMPHLLMAGATGQGKSVGLNSILVSLLYKKHPAYVKFVLVDPKKVELTLFNKIERHFLAKLPGDGEAIITDNHKVINTLNSLCVEMDNRYKLLQDALVRNIIEYNNKFLARKLNPNDGHRFLPYIVVVIDEVADLMMTAGKEIETPIARLAQLARAIGIHLILATQRPSVNVITGMIKANFPARIAFRVSSKIDSRTILDANGADQLIGRGDLLYSGGNEVIRLQCPFVDTPEVERIVDFIGEQRAFPTAYVLPEVKEEGGVLSGDGLDSGDWDPMFEDAARVVVLNQVGSTSMIQRKLKIGYNRAGRLMDQLEDAGIVGGNNGSKARQVLITDERSLDQFLSNLR